MNKIGDVVINIIKALLISIVAVPLIRLLSFVFSMIFEYVFPQANGLHLILDTIIVLTDRIMNLPKDILFGG